MHPLFAHHLLQHEQVKQLSIFCSQAYMTDKKTTDRCKKCKSIFLWRLQAAKTASSVDTANMHTNEVMKTLYQANKVSGNTKATLKGSLGGLISFHRHILRIDKCHKY